MTSEPVTLRERPAGRMVDDFLPSLIVAGEHGLCAGCGEPIALRSVVETIEDLALVQRSVAVFGIGCYTAFSGNFDVESLTPILSCRDCFLVGVSQISKELDMASTEKVISIIQACDDGDAHETTYSFAI